MSLCLSIPQFITSTSFVDQTMQFSPVTLFTPATTGVYRISMGGACTSAGNSPTIDLAWTDQDGNAQTGAYSPIPYAGATGAIAIISAHVGDAVTLSAGFNASVNYSLYVVVEQLF